MAKAKVVHSDDGVTIVFNGDIKNPEPSIGVIKFPGGHVEVSRCSDGTYWAHVSVEGAANIVGSRIDYEPDASMPITDIPSGAEIKHMAIRVANTVRSIEDEF